MKPFYLKGTFEGFPSFVTVEIRSKIVKADIISYNESTQLWDILVRRFDLDIEAQIREYNNFKEHFFESNQKEYDSARRFLHNAPQKTASPQNNYDPIIPMAELLEKIKQFQDARKTKNGGQSFDQ